MADSTRGSGLPGDDGLDDSTTPLDADAQAADETELVADESEMVADDTVLDATELTIDDAPELISDEAIDDALTPDGAELTDVDLVDPPGEVEVAADETEAEELLEADDEIDDTPDKADPEDIEIADEEQLEEATAVARVAKSTKPKPIKRNQTVAPVRKSKPTPKRDDAHNTVVAKRTTPVQFVKQSAGELKKVVWPSASTTQQYFFVVLVFVLFVMFFVAGLDALFGWLLLLWLG